MRNFDFFDFILGETASTRPGVIPMDCTAAARNGKSVVNDALGPRGGIVLLVASFVQPVSAHEQEGKIASVYYDPSERPVHEKAVQRMLFKKKKKRKREAGNLTASA